MKYLAWTALALSGVLSFLIGRGELGQPVPPGLERLAEVHGSIRSSGAIEFDAEALGELPPDEFVFRNVIDDPEHPGTLYIAYFVRGRRWSGRPHPVEVCYYAQGWKELEALPLETSAGATLWSRVMEREGRQIRLVHWLQRPGELPQAELGLDVWARIAGLTRLRQDVASIYWEFDLAAAPSQTELATASQELIDEIERLWSTDAPATSP